MDFQSGCIICGEELVYTKAHAEEQCHFCGNNFSADVTCPDGHYVCDNCHSSSAIDMIQDFCLRSEKTDPLELANELMNNRKVKMHGPEHHFLVPASLLTAYYNFTGEARSKKKMLVKARKRSGLVPGGFCGSHGNCGAAVGSGIFFSLITFATPLSSESWQMSNLMTSKCLYHVAMSGGPRCCKRDTYISIREAVDFLKEYEGVTLPMNREIKCTFSQLNKQCIGNKCEFHQNAI